MNNRATKCQLLNLGKYGNTSFFLYNDLGSILEYDGNRSKGNELLEFGKVIDKPEILKEDGKRLLRYTVYEDFIGLLFSLTTDGKMVKSVDCLSLEKIPTCNWVNKYPRNASKSAH